jgi:hypothetical protein
MGKAARKRGFYGVGAKTFLSSAKSSAGRMALMANSVSIP